MSSLYTAKATATGGRNGQVQSSDGLLNMDVRIPKEMGGPGGATNPEQLFAAGYAACFDSALQFVARAMKAPITESAVTAEVGIGKTADGQGFQLSAKLHVKIDGVERNVAQELLAAAHQVCPYSNATRGNMNVELILT